MPQQKNLIVVLGLVIVVLLGVVLYQADFLPSGGNNATSTTTTTDGVEESVLATSSSEAKPATTVKPAVKVVPKSTGSYINLSYSTPHDAVFVLNTPVKDADIINGENMYYCVLTTAKVAAGATCRDNKVVYGQGFKIKYTEAGNVLQITDVSYLSERKPNMAVGAFRPECNGCSVYIEFSNIRNEQGVILPTKRVLVRAQ